MKRLAKLETIKTPIWILSGAISLILIGMADALTGHELSFSIFYLIPIFFIIWYAGRKSGNIVPTLVYLSGRPVLNTMNGIVDFDMLKDEFYFQHKLTYR